ncbi:MAG: tetratricopeptide repeat protein [Desulfobacter sp.]
MKKLVSVYLGTLLVACLVVVVQICLVKSAMASLPVVKNILIKDSPLSVEFELTGKAPVKVIRIGKKEVLVAIKNVVLAKGYKVHGEKHPAIDSVNVESLDGNVVAVVVVGKKAYGEIDSGFNKNHTRLTVALTKDRKIKTPPVKTVAPAPKAPAEGKTVAAKAPEKKVAPKAVAVPVPAPAPVAETLPPPTPKPVPPPEPTAEKIGPTVEEKDIAPPPVELPPAVEKTPKAKEKLQKTADIKAPPMYVPPKRVKGEFRGDISDIYRGADPLMGCEAKPVENALLLIKKELYDEAYDILEQYVFQENFSCLEQVYYLRAYVFYKNIQGEDYANLIKAERMFQDALVSFPKSRFVPFAYAGVGMIQAALKNMSAAEGYFNIVRKGYVDYTGMPEIQFHLAKIYDEKGYMDKALRLYRDVFQAPMDNSYITDAGVGYGKALFNKRKYFDALSVFNYVVKNDAKKVYESPDLLRFTGESNFELGISKGARDNFIRLLNLFPEIPDKAMILSKVGDAYGMENNEEKALRIYELVREKFPDSPGFINASIGLARYLKTDPEKIEIYEMIKNRFPENTYARIAMMRLAEIYQKNGEYNKCIKEIEDLLSTHPRGLRYEAVKLMQRAYEALFKEQLKADEYTSVLNRYEMEYVKLDKMSSRLIAFRVGTAYLKANLYEEAFNHLITAYKQYKRSERSPELLFGLGRAMDESGRDDDALKLFASFAKRFPKNSKTVDALTRMGRIYLEKDSYAKASGTLNRALAASEKDLDRGGILMLHSDVFEKKGNLKSAARFRERSVKAYTAAPGKNYGILASSYKTLGSTYLQLKSYVQAADAFSKALQFSEGDRAKANLGFLLGDAYQRGNIMDKAKEAFEQVAGTYDSVWARLAQQRLNTMELAEKMINS